MNQFTAFESKNYPKTARRKDIQENSSQEHQMDQSLDNQTNTFDLGRSRKNKSLLGKSKYSEPYCPAADLESFNKTSSKLLHASFKHHDPHMCVC